MKLCSLFLILLFTSCAYVDSGSENAEIQQPTTTVTPAMILANPKQFHKKKVRVIAYYHTHHDGDWIAEDKSQRLEQTISIPNTGETTIILKNGKILGHTWDLDWGTEDPVLDNSPVIVEGWFIKNGKMNHMGETFKTPMLYAHKILELSQSKASEIKSKITREKILQEVQDAGKYLLDAP